MSREDHTRGLSDAEIDRIGRRLLGPPGSSPEPVVLLAVSGGSDSMALMHIVASAVRRAERGRVAVATVDHGLRSGSAEEAAFVATEAQRLGLPHTTLRWEGPKPSTRRQEAARNARYGLLLDLLRREPNPLKLLVTAHTRDDQAETVLMRLARGSGIDGLAGIPEDEQLEARSAHLPDGQQEAPGSIRIVRPLLGIAKSRLIATLTERGLPWREDPSNANPSFERVRIRQAMVMLETLGITSAAIGRSGARLRRASDALDAIARRALRDDPLVRIDPLGFIDLDHALWTDPERCLELEIQIRVLAHAIRAVGGCTSPISLRALETTAANLASCLDNDTTFATTLGRTRIVNRGHVVRITRETGRDMPVPVPIRPGEQLRWDNRFDVQLDQTFGKVLDLRVLGPVGVAVLRKHRLVPARIPAAVLLAVPSLWDGGRLVSVPALANAWARDPRRFAARAEPLLATGSTVFRPGW